MKKWPFLGHFWSFSTYLKSVYPLVLKNPWNTITTLSALRSIDLSARRAVWRMLKKLRPSYLPFGRSCRFLTKIRTTYTPFEWSWRILKKLSFLSALRASYPLFGRTWRISKKIFDSLIRSSVGLEESLKNFVPLIRPSAGLEEFLKKLWPSYPPFGLFWRIVKNIRPLFGWSWRIS